MTEAPPNRVSAALPSDSVPHGRIWRITLPLMLSNVSVPLLGIVDTAVVGQLPGAWNIGAVAVGALIIDVIYWPFAFLRMGTSGFTAQALGSANHPEIRATLGRGLAVALALGLAIVLLQWPIAWAGVALVGPGPDVAELARDYLTIRLWGAPFAMTIYAVHGWLLGLQNTRAVLILQVFLNGANIVLDVVFVLGFGWGVEGVAVATLLSEFMAAGLGLYLVRRQSRHLDGGWDTDRIRAWSGIRAILGVNRDLFIRNACMQASWVMFTAVGARLGDDILAANAVLQLFFMFISYALDGLADAANTLCGNAYGARNVRLFWDTVRKTMMWSAAIAAVSSVLYAVFGSEIVAMISVDDAVRATAGDYLIYVIVLPLVAVWSFQLDGVFVGLTRGGDLRNVLLVSVAAFAVALWLLVPGLGNHGLWAAFLAFQVIRAATLAIRLPAAGRSFANPMP